MTDNPPDAAPDWAIYYDSADARTSDRTTSDDADPYTVAARGVIAIAQEDAEVGRIIISGRDYYWWKPDDGWFGGDIFGLWDYLASPGPKRVLFGRTLPNDEFGQIMDRARTDDYLAPKSAVDPYRDDVGDTR